mmetsp:Transcript_25873/g.57281  ORF Transcript_25873/g.57281 Transcript_25873/m.57281 type:complete len:257 (-) Transcript_25873:449-1219(-)
MQMAYSLTVRGLVVLHMQGGPLHGTEVLGEVVEALEVVVGVVGVVVGVMAGVTLVTRGIVGVVDGLLGEVVEGGEAGHHQSALLLVRTQGVVFGEQKVSHECDDLEGVCSVHVVYTAVLAAQQAAHQEQQVPPGTGADESHQPFRGGPQSAQMLLTEGAEQCAAAGHGELWAEQAQGGICRGGGGGGGGGCGPVCLCDTLHRQPAEAHQTHPRAQTQQQRGIVGQDDYSALGGSAEMAYECVCLLLRAHVFYHQWV